MLTISDLNCMKSITHHNTTNHIIYIYIQYTKYNLRPTLLPNLSINQNVIEEYYKPDGLEIEFESSFKVAHCIARSLSLAGSNDDCKAKVD